MKVWTFFEHYRFRRAPEITNSFGIRTCSTYGEQIWETWKMVALREQKRCGNGVGNVYSPDFESGKQIQSLIRNKCGDFTNRLWAIYRLYKYNSYSNKGQSRSFKVNIPFPHPTSRNPAIPYLSISQSQHFRFIFIFSDILRNENK